MTPFRSLVWVAVASLGIPSLCAQEIGTREGIPPGHRLIEGDIIVEAGEDATIFGNPWTNGQVPFSFHSSLSPWQQRLARLMFQEWEAVAGLDFFLRTNETDYIRVRTSTGNSSFVGQVGGAQNLNVRNWNRRGTPYHEVGHAITFQHEQNRPDRDNFITVLWNNINPAFHSQYALQPAATTVGPYDFGSCMHYPDWGFSINGQPTMQALPPYAAQQALMGQRHDLSMNDAAGAVLVYGPPVPPAITSVDVSQVYSSAGTQRIVLNGDRFFTKSQAKWNGQPVPTRYAGPDQLLVELSQSVLSPGVGLLSVDNLPPGGGEGASFPLTVLGGGPSTTPQAQTWDLGWGCRGITDGPRLSLSAPPVLGTTVQVVASSTVASRAGWFVVSPPAADTLDLQYYGCEIQVDPSTMAVISNLQTDGSGNWSQSFTIPNVPSLAGVELDMQIAVIDPDSDIGLALTNGLRVRFGS